MLVPSKGLGMTEEELTAVVHDHMAELRAAFDLFDVDHDGRLTPGELRTALSAMGLPTSDEEVRKMMAFADHDGNHSISFPEFVDLVEPRPLGEDPEADLRDAFAVLDDDDDGFIDVTELGRAAERSGGFDPAEAQSIVRAVDTDGDGRLSYAEFVRYMTKPD